MAVGSWPSRSAAPATPTCCSFRTRPPKTVHRRRLRRGTLRRDVQRLRGRSAKEKIHGEDRRMGLSKDAFKAIIDKGTPFASRRVAQPNTTSLAVWATLGVTPTKDMKWYNALGQGMGDTLLFSNRAEGLHADRPRHLPGDEGQLPDLAILVGGNNLAENQDKDLRNPTASWPSTRRSSRPSTPTWQTSSSPGSSRKTLRRRSAPSARSKFGQPSSTRTRKSTNRPTKSP